MIHDTQTHSTCSTKQRNRQTQCCWPHCGAGTVLVVFKSGSVYIDMIKQNPRGKEHSSDERKGSKHYYMDRKSTNTHTHTHIHTHTPKDTQKKSTNLTIVINFQLGHDISFLFPVQPTSNEIYTHGFSSDVILSMFRVGVTIKH